jgi:hypothetical protein
MARTTDQTMARSSRNPRQTRNPIATPTSNSELARPSSPTSPVPISALPIEQPGHDRMP